MARYLVLIRMEMESGFEIEADSQRDAEQKAFNTVERINAGERAEEWSGGWDSDSVEICAVEPVT